MARPGLTQHRKFRRLARALGSNIVARGVLELLWDGCYESGDEYIGTSDDIEHAIGWTGAPGMVTTALLEAGAPEGYGFIEPATGPEVSIPAYRIHDLWHHAPDYVSKRRARELERRQKSQPVSLDRRTAPNGDGLGKSSTCQDEGDRTPSPSPSPSLSPAPVGKTVSPEVQPFLRFPVIGSSATEWALSETQVVEWVRLFPGLDVRGECRKALAWSLASPTRRKTSRGMGKFLVGWLSRAVDHGRVERASMPTRPNAVPMTTHVWECPHTPRCPHRAACAIVSARKKPA